MKNVGFEELNYIIPYENILYESFEKLNLTKYDFNV